MVPPIAQTDGITLSSGYALAMLAGAGGVISVLFRLLITSKDRENALVVGEKDRLIKELEGVKKAYEEIAHEAIRSAFASANLYRARDGLPPIPVVAPVLPESHSPSSPTQREAAMIQTQRAALAALKLGMGQPAKSPPVAGP